MTHQDFFTLLRNPDEVQSGHVGELRELVDNYPYFAPARLFYVKALKESNSVLYNATLKASSVYVSNKNWFYFYIHPEYRLSAEPYRKDRPVKKTGDYFEMMDAIEAPESGLSLKSLADRLRSARALVTPAVQERNADSEPVAIKLPQVKDYFDLSELEPVQVKSMLEPTEEHAKKLIRERKYAEALELLKQLNLNNPKKSIYFADQIRFLEKVIANIKK